MTEPARDPEVGFRATGLRDKMAKQMGYWILECPGCAAWPVRSTWLTACVACQRELCRICLPEEARVCLFCQAERQRQAATSCGDFSHPLPSEDPMTAPAPARCQFLLDVEGERCPGPLAGQLEVTWLGGVAVLYPYCEEHLAGMQAVYGRMGVAVRRLEAPGKEES